MSCHKKNKTPHTSCKHCGCKSFFATYLDINDPESLAWLCEECETVLKVIGKEEDETRV